MRRAEWRRRADDPTTLLGWWWRGILRKGLPLEYVFGLAVPVAATLGRPALAAGATLLTIFVGVVRFVRTKDELRPLLPDPVPQGQFRAVVEYGRSGLVTGGDEMALNLIDGWLVAEGVRSHFALRPSDVRSMSSRVETICVLELQDRSTLTLSVPGDREGRILDAWRRFDPDPPGEPTLPPAQVHPQELARWTAWFTLGVGWISLPSVLASCVWGKGHAELRIGLAMVGAAVFFWTRSRLSRLVAISKAASAPAALSGAVSVLGEDATSERTRLHA